MFLSSTQAVLCSMRFADNAFNANAAFKIIKQETTNDSWIVAKLTIDLITIVSSTTEFESKFSFAESEFSVSEPHSLLLLDFSQTVRKKDSLQWDVHTFCYIKNDDRQASLKEQSHLNE